MTRRERSSRAPANAEAAGDGETFEPLAKDAQPAADVGALLGALTDRCADEKRALDRARCQATLAYLRKSLPEHPFAITTRDPAAISVSPYDGSLKGYRIGLQPASPAAARSAWAARPSRCS